MGDKSNFKKKFVNIFHQAINECKDQVKKQIFVIIKEEMMLSMKYFNGISKKVKMVINQSQ